VKTTTTTGTVRKPPVTTSKPPVTTTGTVRKPPVSKGPDASTYVAQGDQFYNAKNYDDALEAYQKAVQINPSLPNAQYRIGWIKNDKEEYEDAIGPLTQSIRLQPTHTSYYELGYSYRKLDRYEEALKAYKEALRIKPDYASAYHD